MTECNQQLFPFANSVKRKVEADFSGGDISSDGGLLLFREVDRKINLLDRLAKILPDDRDPGRIIHSMESMVSQRVYGLVAGWEDLNDHDTLRDDLIFQTIVNRDRRLASPPTLCRMEQKADREAALAINRLMVKVFIESFGDESPEELILDFDATDDPVHGNQTGKFFHGYYRHYCFLPLYVFCDSQPLVAWLRPSNIDGARGAWFALKSLVTMLREAWPEVRIIWRADSGFCRWRMLRWSEENGVDYIVGLKRNPCLEREAGFLIKGAERKQKTTGEKVREFSWMYYGAKAWDKKRLVIAKAEHNSLGSNPRFVITSLRGNAQQIYDKIYCARGDMENRIKEQQLGLFADRTSCHNWWPNQLRLLLSTAAYILIDSLRRKALLGTNLAQAQATRIRLELVKIGAVVIRNTRRVKVHLSSSWPRRKLFELVHRQVTQIRSG
jgi:hypothetical protein